MTVSFTFEINTETDEIEVFLGKRIAIYYFDESKVVLRYIEDEYEDYEHLIRDAAYAIFVIYSEL